MVTLEFFRLALCGYNIFIDVVAKYKCVETCVDAENKIWVFLRKTNFNVRSSLISNLLYVLKLPKLNISKITLLDHLSIPSPIFAQSWIKELGSPYLKKNVVYSKNYLIFCDSLCHQKFWCILRISQNLT